MINIRKLESELWESADLLRAGSKLTSHQYCMPVLGLIFLNMLYQSSSAVILQMFTMVFIARFIVLMEQNSYGPWKLRPPAKRLGQGRPLKESCAPSRFKPHPRREG